MVIGLHLVSNVQRPTRHIIGRFADENPLCCELLNSYVVLWLNCYC